MTIDKTLDHSLQLIAENGAAMERHRAAAESILKSIEKQIIGRIIFARLGKQKGDYKITNIDLSYDGEITAHGIKVLSTGGFGSQRWDLGTVDARRLGLISE